MKSGRRRLGRIRWRISATRVDWSDPCAQSIVGYVTDVSSISIITVRTLITALASITGEILIELALVLGEVFIDYSGRETRDVHELITSS